MYVCVLRCFFFGWWVSSGRPASSKKKTTNDWLVVIAEGEEIKLESTALRGYFGLFLSSRASGVVYH